MNISFFSRDTVRGILKVEIQKSDYADQVNKSLRSHQQKLSYPGFRKGMTPIGIVRKIYGSKMMSDEVSKLLDKHLTQYLKDNQLPLIGEPIVNETEQTQYRFDKEEDFAFYFDLAFVPSGDVELTKENHLTYYQVAEDPQALAAELDSLFEKFGSTINGMEEVGEDNQLKGELTELENGIPKEGGIKKENVTLHLIYFTEEEKNKFIGAKSGSTVTFNIIKACVGEYDRKMISAQLGIPEEEVEKIKEGDFSFVIEDITMFRKAEMNQALFDKVYGEGNVTSEEAFVEKLKELRRSRYTPQSDQVFLLDAGPLFEEKSRQMEWADDIIKRLLTQRMEGKAPQDDFDFPAYLLNTKVRFVQNMILDKYHKSVTQKDVEGICRQQARVLFADSYDMYFFADQVLDQFVQTQLAKEEVFDSYLELARLEKLRECLKSQITVETKEVSLEELQQLIEEKKKENNPAVAE
jgi:trigger factor